MTSLALLVGNNSSTECAAITAKIKRNLQSATGSSFESLKAHAEVGGGLNQLKGIIRHGDFGTYVETNLGLKKQWRARLMKLEVEWSDVLKAIEWAKARELIARSEYSVDGALGLLGKWRQKDTDSETLSDRSSRRQRTCNGASESKSINLLELLFRVWAQLMRAQDYIRFLEAELARRNDEAVLYPRAADVTGACIDSDYTAEAGQPQ